MQALALKVTQGSFAVAGRSNGPRDRITWRPLCTQRPSVQVPDAKALGTLAISHSQVHTDPHLGDRAESP